MLALCCIAHPGTTLGKNFDLQNKKGSWDIPQKLTESGIHEAMEYYILYGEK